MAEAQHRGMSTSQVASGTAALAKSPVVPRRILVWMNQPSHYQTGFFRELALREGVTLSVIYAHGQTAERRELGWGDPEQNREPYTEAVLQGFNPWQIVRIVWRERRAVHLINGVWAEKAFMVAAVALAAVGADFFFHSEAPNPAEERRGIPYFLKRRFGSSMIRRCRGLFLIGSKACEYYSALGVPAKKQFKFCYFSDPPIAPCRQNQGNTIPTVLYLGQFIARKRVEDLIEAVALLKQRDIPCKLRLVGSGPMAAHYAELSRRRGVFSQVSVEASVSPLHVSALLDDVDVLGLVSDFDGWGIVVNEALLRGRPVVVSAGCGASELVASNPSYGLVVPGGAPEKIAQAVKDIVSNPTVYAPNLEEVANRVGCRAMTDHFLACVDYSFGLRHLCPSTVW